MRCIALTDHKRTSVVSEPSGVTVGKAGVTASDLRSSLDQRRENVHERLRRVHRLAPLARPVAGRPVHLNEDARQGNWERRVIASTRVRAARRERDVRLVVVRVGVLDFM